MLLTSVSFEGANTSLSNVNGRSSFMGDLDKKYYSGGIGTYTRNADDNTYTWTKQP
jgi:hypothetical protein